MNRIYPKHSPKDRGYGRFRRAWQHTRKRRLAAALLLLFALVNGGVYLYYRDRTYPNAVVNGQPVGSLPRSELQQRLRDMRLLPEEVQLTYQGESTTVRTDELGMGVNYELTARELAGRGVWLPVANFAVRQDVPVFIAIQPKAYQRTINDIGRAYRSGSTDAVLRLKAGDFVITPEKNARTIDAAGSQARIVEALGEGRRQAELLMKEVPPRVTAETLRPQLEALQAQRNTDVTLKFQGKSRKFSPTEIGSWFTPGNGGFTIASHKVNDAVNDAGMELGANITNGSEVATKVKSAVETKKDGSFDLSGRPMNKKAYTYCIEGRGVAAGELDGLASKADATLNAKRGWSLGGNISFRKASADCDFTLWLAAADQLPSFGAICDPMWSCAVYPNVIININRWNGASEAWNKQGGSLEEYRAMVINHEVGHWLGFNHSSCPVPGQPAPVMQQQSIDLQGCSFNAWPSTTERVTLRDYLGL